MARRFNETATHGRDEDGRLGIAHGKMSHTLGHFTTARFCGVAGVGANMKARQSHPSMGQKVRPNS